MPSLSKSIGRELKRQTKPKEPLWKGPEVDGITQSLLSRFLVCRERFRLLVIEGLRPRDEFMHRIEYGSMWHCCEEEYARSGKVRFGLLHEYCTQLCRRYPLQQETIIHWYNVCKVQFPAYVNYWSRHPDVRQRTPLFQERVFGVPYKLPSGRIVKLRGKWDSVDLIGRGTSRGIYLQENKSKGEIIEQQLRRQLSFDLQTMLYLVALQEDMKHHPEEWAELGRPLKGVRYNVIRRPLSGGKHSIKKLKPTKKNPQGESSKEFYARVSGIISAEPEFFFMRWKVEVKQSDINRFKCEFLDPILEQLCDWWEWLSACELGNEFIGNYVHYRTPYGFFDPLEQGRGTDLDEYLATGSKVGLQHVDRLFKELD